MPNKNSPDPALKHESFKALKWNYLGAFLRVGLQFVIGVVLARLLGPEAFGLIAVATLVLSLGALFADFGLASVLIQRKEVSSRDIRFVFTLQALIGLTLTLVLEMCAGLVANFFKRPDALPVLQALFLTFVLQGIGQTAGALLRRQLDFYRLQMSQITSYLIGYLALGIPLAFNGVGVWSLVIAQLSQTALNTLFTYAMTRHPLTLCLSSDSTGFVSFGLKVTATNLCNWGLSCLDSVVLGRTFGTTQLGLYNRSLSLVTMPTYYILTSLQGVLFSATARMQDDAARLRQTYLAALGVIGFICIPMFGVVAVIPETMILGTYGTHWLEAVTLLTPLALAMPFSALMGLGGPVMTGIGKVEYELGTQFLCLVLFVPLLWFASGYTLQTVAWSVLSAYVMRFAMITHVTLRLLKESWYAVFSVLLGPIMLAVICAAITWIVDRELRATSLPAALRLIGVGGFAALTAALGFLLGQRWLVSKPVAQLFRQATPSLPVWARRLVFV